MLSICLDLNRSVFRVRFYRTYICLEALKSNLQMFQSNTIPSLKNLETQVGQLALTL